MMKPSLKMILPALLLALTTLQSTGFAVAGTSDADIQSQLMSKIATRKIQIRVTDQSAFRNLVLSDSEAVVGVMNGKVRPLTEMVQLVGKSPTVICLVSSEAQLSSDVRFGDDFLLKSVRTKELSSSRETELTMSAPNKMSVMAGCLKTDHSDLKLGELSQAFQGILEFSYSPEK